MSLTDNFHTKEGKKKNYDYIIYQAIFTCIYILCLKKCIKLYSCVEVILVYTTYEKKNSTSY